jgi:streptogramin lyase
MRKIRIALLLGAAILFMAGVPHAFAASAALSGQVSSEKEGAMEGVLVSAKKDGSTITTTVVSDAKGQFSFPADRLSPGHYTISVRAFGYSLDGPKTADVSAAGNATAMIRLVPTTNLAAQMTNAEWLASAPGDLAIKKRAFGCGQCHTLARPLMSTHTAEEFATKVMPRMASYASQAYPLLIQTRNAPSNRGRGQNQNQEGRPNPLAVYLASINLSTSKTHSYELKGFARPKGADTKVIITEYDLPRKTMQPHDVIVDDTGTVWSSDFGENSLSKLDPKTGKVTEYPYQPTRPGYANGNLNLEEDREGNLWLGMMNQAGVAKFDRKTGKFEFYPLPASMLNETTQQAMLAPLHWEVDGKVWFNDADNRAVGRVDIKTGTFEPWRKPFDALPKEGQHGAYGLATDSNNDLFFLDFPNDYIGRIDAKTGTATFYQVPTPDAHPRRGRMDNQDRLWFAEWYGGKVGMLDPKTGQIKEWQVPDIYAAPYDAVVDKNGEIWTGNDNDDRITRIDEKTGKTVQYLMPHEVNVRRVFVDNSAPRPTFWAGSNHTASIFKVEPLE